MIKLLKKLKDIIDPNYWATKIGDKSGLYDKAENLLSVNEFRIRRMEMVGMANRWWIDRFSYSRIFIK